MRTKMGIGIAFLTMALLIIGAVLLTECAFADDWVGGWTTLGGATATSYEGKADVNSDGVDDVLVWDGRLWMYISGAGWTRVGSSTAIYGGTVDENNDGYDDIIVNDGRVWLHYGAPGYSDWQNGWVTVGGATATSYEGKADVNNDGKDDILVWDGRLWMYISGEGWTRVGGSTAIYGGTVDENNDGYDDIIVNDGRVYLHYGATGYSDWQDGWVTVGGATATSYEGKADVNNDGKDDILVWDGRLWMNISGYGWTHVGSVTANYGGTVDVNGDGYDDLIVYDGPRSWLHVATGTVSGGNWENAWTHIGGFNHSVGDYTAVYVDAIDVNGDGNDDLVVSDVGRYWLNVSEGTANDYWDSGWLQIGAPTAIYQGSADVNGDGRDDIIVYDGRLFLNLAEGDTDNDGVPDASDCNDNDATVYPGAPELCDGKDNNCDGVLPVGETDADGDTYMVCEGDCNDNDAGINPGATELADCIDNDCDGLVDENDSIAPSGKISVSPAYIWPPNHEMVNITVDASGITDANLDTVAITDITSSEPDNDLGDGDTTGDKIITGDLTGAVRAERSGIKGTGVGRTYTVTVTAIDCAGNETDFTATVVVPHDKRK